ncbi:MAG: alanine--tRNA ligase [Clostridia bacterium]|nr:alanine--tRNA ligase [Clostridia bacterium]
MQWTGLNELREKYLAFFESKGHLRLPSFSLVPNNDKSLLLINSGMAPMKKYFTGEITPPRKRVTTCQKCIRTPDIERVGKTARHGTYFEMLGNFSFGDYFKHEATAWAWEFCTKVLELPEDRIWISIYENDDEAKDIWVNEVGVDASHIVRLGKEDNFWEHGSGPCGPCSELYFDRGEKYGCDNPNCGVGCECDRYVEFWNLVFTQFDNDGNGNYSPLENPNIDTGMGMERLACIMQDVGNLFEVDTVQNIMKHISSIAGVTYKENEKTDVSLRVITDHIRSTVFMIGDGVMPSNAGRGYVLRRLLRRAARHGRLLGIREPFLYKVADTVIAENHSAYPELADKQDFIRTLIEKEEEAFGKTIDGGLSVLDFMLSELEGDTLSGENAFKLYDTYGFPIDLTRDILEEKGFKVDEEAFNALMAEQRTRARDARKDAGADAWKGKAAVIEQLEPGTFVGYTMLETDATVKAIVVDNEMVDCVTEGDEAIVVLDVTPFYAQSGGQVGDVGTLTTEGGVFEVLDTFKGQNGVFAQGGVQQSGDLRVGDVVKAAVHVPTRRSTMRNHTAAHLLQAALREVLGTHVEQAGQLVDSQKMRFDFTHFVAMTAEEIEKVETMVNGWILDAVQTDIREMPIEEARKLGAMALFGEKYGDVVRVVSVPGVSVEFCGGTHAENTAQLGLFRIVSESSVAAGVRRIEAVTGANVLALLNQYTAQLDEAAQVLKANSREDLVRRATQVMTEAKETQAKLTEAENTIAAGKIHALFDNAKDHKGIKVIAAMLTDVDGDALRTLADRARDIDGGNTVALLAAVNAAAGSVTLCCCCGAAAVKRGANAGTIVREAATICGGRGGGRPDMAMAGGKDVSKVDEALYSVTATLDALLKD